MVYSKTLEVKDYNDLPATKTIYDMQKYLDKNAGYRFEHPHRAWEYGIILNALIKNKCKDIVDVGGGGSLFAPTVADLGINILQIDPEDYSLWTREQSAVLNKSLPYLLMDFFDYNEDTQFDAVVSISTLEHIEDDLEFFIKMLSYVKPGGLLAITVDFHPSGEALIYPAHLRTYNREAMEELYLISSEDFKFFGGGVDYTYRTNDVNGYTFASLILRKDDD